VYIRRSARLPGVVTKTLTTVVRCLAAVALAMILPPWVTAVPGIFLSAALAIAVVRDPRGADRAAKTLRDLLTPPE
jgi:hypothetical protein